MKVIADKTKSPLDGFKEKYWSSVSDQMQRCEHLLWEIAGRPGHILGESCTFTLAAGGKRLRPLLVFLSTKREVDIGEKQYAAAAAVELIHMATLVHDDVLDGAEMRRGQPTLVARYGLPVSVAAGDYLFSTAFEILTSAGSPRAVSLLTHTSLGLSIGELTQMEETADFSLSPQAYFDRCRLKTSGLFATACRLGALLSGCSEETIAAIGEFGGHMGLSFQVSDDILDFSGDTSLTGKKIGTDLKDGTVTLPLILALKRDPDLIKLLAGRSGEEQLEEICRRVNASGALAEALKHALGYVDRAKEALAKAEDELDTRPLALIAEATVYRQA
jgi:geranylgeranyl pyrophosphate synthase